MTTRDHAGTPYTPPPVYPPEVRRMLLDPDPGRCVDGSASGALVWLTGRNQRAGLAMLVFLCALPVGLAVRAVFHPGLLSIFALLVGSVAGALVMRGVIRRLTSRSSARVLQSALLDRSLCPSCLYGLESLAPDPRTTLTTCPECGAAWRINGPGPSRVHASVGAGRTPPAATTPPA